MSLCEVEGDDDDELDDELESVEGAGLFLGVDVLGTSLEAVAGAIGLSMVTAGTCGTCICLSIRLASIGTGLCFTRTTSPVAPCLLLHGTPAILSSISPSQHCSIGSRRISRAVCTPSAFPTM